MPQAAEARTRLDHELPPVVTGQPGRTGIGLEVRASGAVQDALGRLWALQSRYGREVVGWTEEALGSYPGVVLSSHGMTERPSMPFDGEAFRFA